MELRSGAGVSYGIILVRPPELNAPVSMSLTPASSNSVTPRTHQREDLFSAVRALMKLCTGAIQPGQGRPHPVPALPSIPSTTCPLFRPRLELYCTATVVNS